MNTNSSKRLITVGKAFLCCGTLATIPALTGCATHAETRPPQPHPNQTAASFQKPLPGSGFSRTQAENPGTPAQGTDNNDICGIWRNEDGVWNLNRSGAGTFTLKNNDGSPETLTNYVTWTHDPSSGKFTFTIKRMTLTGSSADYDNKTFAAVPSSIPYSLANGQLKLGPHVYHR